MKKFIALASLLLANAAHAELLDCQTTDGSVNVKASSEVLVVSDSSIGAGKKTTARFTAANGTLAVKPQGEATSYVGDVDLRFNDSDMAGRNLMGTKLGQLDTIEVSIFDSSAQEGQIIATKRNGQVIKKDLTCIVR
jgi:hypothetical protein